MSLDTIQTLALIVALALHHPRIADRINEWGERKRPAVWFRRDGVWVGWSYGYGSSTSWRLFRWPWTEEGKS